MALDLGNHEEDYRNGELAAENAALRDRIEQGWRSSPTREICSECAMLSAVGFHVPDHIWAAAIPPPRREDIFCLQCFSRLADRAYVAWDREITFYPISKRTHREVVQGADREMVERIAALEGELRDYEQSMAKANARIAELEAANKELHDVLADHGSPDGDESGNMSALESIIAEVRTLEGGFCPLCADRGYVSDPRFPGSARMVWCSCPAGRRAIGAFGESAYATPEQYFAGMLASREPELVGYDPAEESMSDRAERRSDAVLEPDGSERGRR